MKRKILRALAAAMGVFVVFMLAGSFGEWVAVHFPLWAGGLIMFGMLFALALWVSLKCD